ncbi:hypothetical protein ACUW9N_000857 [Staphylococcus auricularis]|uniref:Uncharacterized protein n=1 Tax=Staphylococcus auricularis TaxID=29379 RepID=A0AAP8PMV5_9STAP|nr:hypothetical protein [Staphylococcus auricularis]MCG7342489.1 hypothetical protein [Staphylococcus auricularis]PNZ66197.1 hypothetical protein CD158_09780 [Staphylococcus auricularis]QPT05282.1 hypothetical protein I6G39_06135 [Staphylococcus auricularis]SQJ11729.1 Uncharacterised protein [Staphylococcus auricularis]BCU52349.1 hypothetical protein JCM2421_11210 [Staphylococcus auricularis]
MQNLMKTVAKAYMISGDMNGNYGKRRNAKRKQKLYIYNDVHQTAKDWNNTGLDMQNALNMYADEKELRHE